MPRDALVTSSFLLLVVMPLYSYYIVVSCYIFFGERDQTCQERAHRMRAPRSRQSGSFLSSTCVDVVVLGSNNRKAHRVLDAFEPYTPVSHQKGPDVNGDLFGGRDRCEKVF